MNCVHVKRTLEEPNRQARESARSLKRKVKLRLDEVLQEVIDVSDLPYTLLSKLVSALGSPAVQFLGQAAQDQDVDAIITADVHPSQYIDRDTYFADKVVCSFLRKYPFPGREAACHAAALSTFDACERQCLMTNIQLHAYASGAPERDLPDADGLILMARDKIARVLGRLKVDEWLESCKFGPGVAFGVPETSDYQKLGSVPSCTEALVCYMPGFLAEYQAWTDSLTYTARREVEVMVVQGGKHSVVPKDAKTHRNIEIQPLVNLWLQSGLGAVIRRRLRNRAGIDLNDQTRNQKLAREGSLTGFWATIDLSNASDTVASRLVELLLPPRWFFALNLVRTQYALVNDEWVWLQRFSSMGNGFTFELESLIFWAISQSAVELQGSSARVSVYGDDIIVPAVHNAYVRQALKFCGFTPNEKKSFSTGPFRESCGADWWEGQTVRPYFLKDIPQDVASLMSLANGLKRAAGRFNHNHGYDRRFASAWYTAVRRIPPAVRKHVSFGFTDTDTMVLAGRERNARQLVFLPWEGECTSWYTAKATALYRLWRRRVNLAGMDEEVRDSSLTVLVPTSNTWQKIGYMFDDLRERKTVTDYARDKGRWVLRSAVAVRSPHSSDDWL